jgi:hypothetical protein
MGVAYCRRTTAVASLNTKVEVFGDVPVDPGGR